MADKSVVGSDSFFSVQYCNSKLPWLRRCESPIGRHRPRRTAKCSRAPGHLSLTIEGREKREGRKVFVQGAALDGREDVVLSWSFWGAVS